MSETYNGYTNYETWLVNLWIDNEQSEQEYWMEQAEEALAHTDCPGDAVAALSNELEAAFGEACEGQCTTPGVFADLLNSALSEVNWHEIAEHFIDAAKEESHADG